MLGKTINVFVEDPTGKLIYSSNSQIYQWYDSTKLNVSGDYKICFGNDEAREKQLYINILANSKHDTVKRIENEKQLNETHTYMVVRIYNRQK